MDILNDPCELPMMRPDQISHVRWANWHVAELVKSTSTSKVAKFYNLGMARVEEIINGHPVGFRVIQKIAGSAGLSVAEIMVDPSVKTEWYRETDIKYFSVNLKKAMEEAGVSSKDIQAPTAICAATVAKWRSGSGFPMSDNLQKLADTLEMEVADLFLPSGETRIALGLPSHGVPDPSPDQLSHVSFVNDRIKDLVGEIGITGVAARLGNVSHQRVERFARGGRMSYRTMAALGRELDLSIGEVMLRPDVDTEWYADTDAVYFPGNLDATMRDLGVSSAALAKRIGITSSSVGAWREGKVIPYSDNLQKLAAVLEIEVADLFLPPE